MFLNYGLISSRIPVLQLQKIYNWNGSTTSKILPLERNLQRNQDGS
jgi:hypothetical protein